MAQRPLVLIHGYSDTGESFQTWVKLLSKKGRDVRSIRVCSYESLTNEVTIPDIAEGFDRALREEIGLKGDEPFDAIVHSTGMLVIRSWLSAYAKRRDRLKHLIGLAPASFGSPLAHKGRSWLGGIFKGRKELGPDFLDAGDRILEGLELGSRFTWDLTDKDLFGSKPYYGPDGDTPYVFIFCGSEAYGGIRRLVNEPGTDGTVRWAGCALNARKITLDLTRNVEDQARISFSNWHKDHHVDIPLIPVEGLNHASILENPTDELVNSVHTALEVNSKQELDDWYKDSSSLLNGKLTPWQQFVIRVTDERGDPITDYFIQLEGVRKDGGSEDLHYFDVDVHVFSGDSSLRNFHINLEELQPENLQSLSLNIIASSGSSLVAYHGFTAGDYDMEGVWHATL
ncbi:esterase/lipase family protein, partial [Paenibacillus sp. UNC451MF]|uniref:esterase/lipase family protein n=1 Tax=Paenibacillus sp. UNC451MF TaxID=1449063 RepID=UPI0006908A83